MPNYVRNLHDYFYLAAESTFLALTIARETSAGNVAIGHSAGKEMHKITGHIYIIDTPGIKDFGVVEFERDNISMYFPDIRKYAGLCKFNNCKHIDDPGCRVLEAVKNKNIYISRYESYLNILLSLEKA